MKACHSDQRSKAKVPPCTKELAANLQQAIIDQLGPRSLYVVVFRSADNDLAPNGFISNQRDRQRLIDWLRHMADGLERSP